MFLPEGFLAQHMLAHVVAMGVAAPLLVLGWRAVLGPLSFALKGQLAAATIVQIALLWGWHVPSVLAAAVASPAIMAAMHLTLFAASVWFWSAVVDATLREDWSPLAALLITGKLFCLLGVLLTFAPRAVYWQLTLLPACFGEAGGSLPNIVADQQLAGLVMLTACPLVYVGAAIVIARRWLATLHSRGWAPAGGRS